MTAVASPVGTQDKAGRQPAVVVQGLTKRYGGRIAIEDLNLAVHRGEIYGFLGPNGAGKTTTL